MKELFYVYFLSNDLYELICDPTFDFLYCFMHRPVPRFAFTSWSCVLKSCNLHSKHSNKVTCTTFPWLKMTDDLQIEWLHKTTSKWSKCVDVSQFFSICLHCIIASLNQRISACSCSLRTSELGITIACTASRISANFWSFQRCNWDGRLRVGKGWHNGTTCSFSHQIFKSVCRAPFGLRWVCWCFPPLWNWSLSRSTLSFETRDLDVIVSSPKHSPTEHGTRKFFQSELWRLWAVEQL